MWVVCLNCVCSPVWLSAFSLSNQCVCLRVGTECEGMLYNYTMYACVCKSHLYTVRSLGMQWDPLS